MAVPAHPVNTAKAPEPTLSERLAKLIARIRKMLRPPRQIRPSLAGYAFMFLTLGVGFAALNTGNNLLYLVLGMMLSLIAVSGVLSELSVMRLTVVRHFPPEVVVGRDAMVQLTVRNNKRWLPAVAVWVEEDEVRTLEADPCFLAYAAGQSEVHLRGGYCFNRRGRQQLQSVEISTTYPFGLFRRSYHFSVSDEVLVLPRVEPVLPQRGRFEEQQGEAPISRKGSGEEFFGLRSYVPGEDPRLIHWKTSARRGRLLLKETSAQQRQRVVIKLELANPLPEENAYEEALTRVVSYAAHFLERGYQVAVDVPGGAVPFESGGVHLRRILRAVALAPRAGEAAEQAASNVRWPAGARVLVRVAGLAMTVEERL